MRDEVAVENPVIFVIDRKITNIQDVLPLLEGMQSGRPLPYYCRRCRWCANLSPQQVAWDLERGGC